jgi:hypothetical protein
MPCIRYQQIPIAEQTANYDLKTEVRAMTAEGAIVTRIAQRVHPGAGG